MSARGAMQARVTVRHEGRIWGQALLDPNGGHQLIVTPEGGASEYRWSRQQVAELRALLDWFEGLAAETDAGADFMHPKIVKPGE